MVKILLAAAFALSALHAVAWTPPEKPDAREILNGARDDRIAGRFEDALQKHIWFHREAIKHEPAMVGVRGSFAIADWAHLASRYPPAMTALLAERSTAAREFSEGKDALDNFGDVAAIDRALEEWTETYRLFVLLESRDEALARRAYAYAQDALIEAKDFVRSARYMDPERELRMLKEMQASIARSGRKPFPMEAEIMGRMEAERIGRVVAILVLGSRREEAVRVAEKARAEFKNDALPAVLVRSLEGQLPPPLFSKADGAAYKAVKP